MSAVQEYTSTTDQLNTAGAVTTSSTSTSNPTILGTSAFTDLATAISHAAKTTTDRTTDSKKPQLVDKNDVHTTDTKSYAEVLGEAMAGLIEMGVSQLEAKNASVSLQQSLAQKNNELQKSAYKKAADLLKQIHDKENQGILDDIGDFFKDVGEGMVEFFKEMGNAISSLFTGHFEEAGKSFLKATGIQTLIDDVKNIVKAIEKGQNVARSIATLAIDMLLICVIPMIGMFILAADNTKTDENGSVQASGFRGDLVDLSMIPVKVIEALSALIMAGAEAIFGDSKGAEKSLKNAKDAGMAILNNPQFKALSELAMVVIIAVAVCSGQAWLAAGMIALMVASSVKIGGETIMQHLTDGIAKGFVALGMNEKDAKLAADITVIVAITLATLGAAAGSSASTAASTASEALAEGAATSITTTTAEVAAEVAATETGQVTAASSEVVSNSTSRFMSGLNAASPGLLAMGMAMQGTDVATDAAEVVDPKHKELVKYMLMIISVVLEILGGYGMLQGSGAAQTAEQVAENSSKTVLGRLSSSLSMNEAELNIMMSQGQRLAVGTQVIEQLVENVKNIQIGSVQKQQAFVEALSKMCQYTTQYADSVMKSTNEEISDINKTIQKNITTLMNTIGLQNTLVTQALMA